MWMIVLTELGHKHAAAVAERLKDEGISEIYISKMYMKIKFSVIGKKRMSSAMM